MTVQQQQQQQRHMMVSPQAPNPYQHPEITQSHQPAHHQMPPPAAPVTWVIQQHTHNFHNIDPNHYHQQQQQQQLQQQYHMAQAQFQARAVQAAHAQGGAQFLARAQAHHQFLTNNSVRSPPPPYPA